MTGKPVADKITQDLIIEVEKLLAEKVTPRLAIVRLGQKPDDISYEKGALARCRKIGIETMVVKLPSDTSQEMLIDAINKLNNDKSVNGILLFRPLPKGIDERVIKQVLSYEKDVDCFTHINEGKVYEGDPTGFPPCTPSAVIEILDYYNVDIVGKSATVIGASNVVGKPMALMLLARKATVTVCNSKTTDLPHKGKQADILVVAIGKPKMINGSYVKEGAVVIDIGINELEGKLCGDVDYTDAEAKAALITPVPNGVGSVTTSVLAKHVIKACKLQNGLI